MRTAEILTTFELGRAATPEQRAPALAKHRSACEKAQLTAAEHACIGKARDTWAALACAPRLYPDRQAASLAGCDAVAARMRAGIITEMPSDVGSSGTAMLDQMVAILQRACAEDPWPAQVRECIMATRIGDLPALQRCQDAMPKDLQDKLQQRFKQEMPQQ